MKLWRMGDSPMQGQVLELDPVTEESVSEEILENLIVTN